MQYGTPAEALLLSIKRRTCVCCSRVSLFPSTNDFYIGVRHVLSKSCKSKKSRVAFIPPCHERCRETVALNAIIWLSEPDFRGRKLLQNQDFCAWGLIPTRGPAPYTPYKCSVLARFRCSFSRFSPVLFWLAGKVYSKCTHEICSSLMRLNRSDLLNLPVSHTSESSSHPMKLISS